MSSVNRGEEVFFDTTDKLLMSEGQEFFFESSGYDLWLREPQSVRIRREIFLSRMGFIESETMGLERIIESSGAGGIQDDNLLSERRKSNSEANSSVDFSDQDWLDDLSIDVEGDISEILVSVKQCELKQVQACLGDSPTKTKKVMRWWRHFTEKMKRNQGTNVSKKSKLWVTARKRVEPHRKRYMECSAVYAGQQLNAHNGIIWTMKFSPDGKYLASGGEDGVVCIWRVTMLDSSSQADKHSLDIEDNHSRRKKKSIHASVVIPEKIFRIEEEPLQKFQGHSSDVLDLAWSTSNHLLSASMDNTVRLWRAGSDKCLGVFHHSNYVTCVQFNPVDENYFISGSIDGKIRIWGFPRRRVEEWANVQDIVTAVCYHPNGKGFVVGSVSGTCRFYELSGDELLLSAEMNIHGRKKSSGNRITGIQFLKNDSQRMMITSEDSKIRIFDGLEVVRKYRGLTKSGSQTSASFTSSGRHIVSVGEDSRVYLWNHDDLCIQTAKQAKSTRSWENFISQGVSVVLPWSDSDIGHDCLACGSSPSSVLAQQDSWSRMWDSERFSLANWFSMDGSFRASITWPEEKLPLWDSPSTEHECQPCNACGDHHQHHKNDGHGSRIQSTTWGLVFVTANSDGTIRTFHNYGLPIRT